MPGEELAPWEEGSGRRRAAPDRKSSKPEEPYKLVPDDKLPDVLRPEGGAMVATGDFSVPRPAIATPRAPQPRTKMAFMALGAMELIGAVFIALPYIFLDEHAGALRPAIAAIGGLLVLAGLVVCALESGRLTQYRTLTFFPAVLCYGSTASFTKFAGPAGMAGISSSRIRGSGRGLLNMVFDRSAHAAAPPEVVALLLDRGGGPELVGVEWDAVRSCQRGDIVWYHAAGPSNYIFFHLMVPYAPAIATDRATKEEVFRALKVGKPMFKDFPKRESGAQAMPKSTKLIKTDASGNIVATEDSSGKGQSFEEAGEQDVELKLSALGGNLGGEQYQQMPGGEQEFPAEEAPQAPQKPASGRRPAAPPPARGKYDPLQGATEYSPPPPNVGKYKLADPGKPLGGYGEQDQSGEV